MARDGLERFRPQSSAVRQATYNRATKQLAVAYKGGATYVYNGVSRQRFAAMKRSGSVGRFVNRSIKRIGAGASKVPRAKGALRSALGARSSVSGSSTSNS